jgi:sirohydrochlorin cobaltochelatase
MRRVLLLAMHGAPPNDFPPVELAEFMRLHAMHEAGQLAGSALERYRELEHRLRSWPRTAENDPFHAASMALGQALEKADGSPVVVAFNEFCAPDIEDGLGQAAQFEPEQVVVMTPMLTPGGEHAEREIPQAVDVARKRFPAIRFDYAWPIPITTTAAFLAEHLRRTFGEGRPV